MTLPHNCPTSLLFLSVKSTSMVSGAENRQSKTDNQKSKPKIGIDIGTNGALPSTYQAPQWITRRQLSTRIVISCVRSCQLQLLSYSPHITILNHTCQFQLFYYNSEIIAALSLSDFFFLELKGTTLVL